MLLLQRLLRTSTSCLLFCWGEFFICQPQYELTNSATFWRRVLKSYQWSSSSGCKDTVSPELPTTSLKASSSWKVSASVGRRMSSDDSTIANWLFNRRFEALMEYTALILHSSVSTATLSSHYLAWRRSFALYFASSSKQLASFNWLEYCFEPSWAACLTFCSISTIKTDDSRNPSSHQSKTNVLQTFLMCVSLSWLLRTRSLRSHEQRCQCICFFWIRPLNLLQKVLSLISNDVVAPFSHT